MPNHADESSDHYSPESYRQILELALQKDCKFISFLADRNKDNKSVYLRHDVHWSLTAAVQMAKINHSLGISATFCILLRSRLYNMLCSLSLDRAGEIHDLGQHIALHFFLPSENQSNYHVLEDMILADYHTLKQYLPELEPVFSWHNPTRELLQRGLELELPGFINCYHSRYFKEIPYYSDSLIRYSVDEFRDIISRHNSSAMQLLIHPDHWIPGGSNFLETMSANWIYAIRELEYEFKLSRIVLNDGMPEKILLDFARQWQQAAAEDLGKRHA